MVTAWNTLSKMRDNEVGGTVTLGQILDLLGDEDNTVPCQPSGHGGHQALHRG